MYDDSSGVADPKELLAMIRANDGTVKQAELDNLCEEMTEEIKARERRIKELEGEVSCDWCTHTCTHIYMHAYKHTPQRVR